jgi:hypothetical protein
MGTEYSEHIWAGDQDFNGKKLSQIFDQEVRNDKIAWYVDYFTQDAAQFNVRFLAGEDDDPKRVMMTNENKEQRDPNDIAGSQWEGADVAEWFGKTKPQHTWVAVFAHDTGEVFGIHVEANRVFPFGARALSLPVENLWREYVEHGILGPLKACLSAKNAKLVAIVADARFETLDGYGLTQDYMLTLAAVLDK